MLKTILILCLSCLMSLPAMAAQRSPAPVTPAVSSNQLPASELRAKFEALSQRKQAKLERKVQKLKDKLNVGTSPQETEETGTVRLGLVVLLVGAIVAILGFAGIGSILIQIGIVVFAVGLVLWLLGLLS